MVNICPQCGRENSDKTNFCEYCGKELYPLSTVDKDTQINGRSSQLAFPIGIHQAYADKDIQINGLSSTNEKPSLEGSGIMSSRERNTSVVIILFGSLMLIVGIVLCFIIVPETRYMYGFPIGTTDTYPYRGGGMILIIIGAFVMMMGAISVVSRRTIRTPSKWDQSVSESMNSSNIREDMRFCRYCGNNIDVDSVFCKHCGKQL